jgi:hypothetical protein
MTKIGRSREQRAESREECLKCLKMWIKEEYKRHLS